MRVSEALRILRKRWDKHGWTISSSRTANEVTTLIEKNTPYKLHVSNDDAGWVISFNHPEFGGHHGHHKLFGSAVVLAAARVPFAVAKEEKSIKQRICEWLRVQEWEGVLTAETICEITQNLQERGATSVASTMFGPDNFRITVDHQGERYACHGATYEQAFLAVLDQVREATEGDNGLKRVQEELNFVGSMRDIRGDLLKTLIARVERRYSVRYECSEAGGEYDGSFLSLTENKSYRVDPQETPAEAFVAATAYLFERAKECTDKRWDYCEWLEPDPTFNNNGCVSDGGLWRRDGGFVRPVYFGNVETTSRIFDALQDLGFDARGHFYEVELRGNKIMPNYGGVKDRAGKLLIMLGLAKAAWKRDQRDQLLEGALKDLLPAACVWEIRLESDYVPLERLRTLRALICVVGKFHGAVKLLEELIKERERA